MRYVALLRVSTDAQVDGYGLDVQRADVEAWAKRTKHRVVEWFVEEGVSGGAPLNERPGLVGALIALTNERAAGLIVPRLDRLSRDLILQEHIYAQLVGMGARLDSAVPAESAYLEHDPDDPTRALVRRILGAVADYERQLIRLRLQKGQDRKRAAGGYAVGAPPFGWDAVGRDLVPNPAEQAVRKQIKAWARAGWSTRRIAAELTERRVPTKHSASWQSATIARIIKYDRRTGPVRPVPPVIGSDTDDPELGSGNEAPGELINASA